MMHLRGFSQLRINQGTATREEENRGMFSRSNGPAGAVSNNRNLRPQGIREESTRGSLNSSRYQNSYRGPHNTDRGGGPQGIREESTRGSSNSSRNPNSYRYPPHNPDRGGGPQGIGEESTRGSSNSSRNQNSYRGPHNTDRGEGRPNSRHGFSDNNSNQRRGQRMYPIGVKVMQSLLEKEPYMIPVELLKNNSGYDILLNESDLREFKIGLIIKLLERSVTSRANDEGVIDLLMVTFRNVNFCQKLMYFISEMKFESRNATEYLPLVASIIAEFLRLSPSNAYSLISNLVDICFGVIIHLKNEDPSSVNDLDQQFENIQLQIKESRSKVRNTQKSGSTKYMDPPDDFREHSVIPTCSEVNALDRPFLRENIINGHYENTDHYLDVQFRLLKEDFIRPLREGLQTYRRTNAKRNPDVRVYLEVTLDSSAIDSSEYVHYLKLNIRKGFKIENSKSLMYGNIVCISSDNFETMITASIVSRDKLKDHLVAVKLETDPFKLEKQIKYTVIESRSYFVSYKHTLTALQNIREVPLKDYLVHVNETKSPPDYIARFTTYEIKFGLNITREVCLLDPIEYWPTCEEMKMDKSQRKALHGALTRQLAVIQGPPGTGKTFLGLQLTKILLHNRDVWNPRKTHPILVVCYTNHALDQFLEGILAFTTNVIRVGSQSKNEALAEYQINKRIFRSTRNHDDDQITKMYYQLRSEQKQLQQIIEKTNEILKALNNPGIVSYESFEKEFPSVIPDHLRFQVMRHTMKGFLTGEFDDTEEINAFNMQDNGVMLIDDEAGEEAYDVDEEILREEEEIRMLDDEDDEQLPDEELQKIHVPYFAFEITPKEIINKIVLFESYLKEDPFNSKNRVYAENIQVLMLVNRAITAGQLIKFNAEECRQLQRYTNLDAIDFIQRWKLYKYWIYELGKKYQERLSILEDKHMKLSKSLLSIKDLRYLSFMKTVDIVGMTTTGAAQYCKLLHDLAPPIVIVEEAAEIMEAHIVTSLSTECKHLIIIGDHQQLRPKPSVYELGIKYHLDTSFFERMIKNGIVYETLEFQHRMKPMISNLLVPTIYEDLKDHPSVFKHPKVKGIKKDLFFLDHTVFENYPGEEVESFENEYEAEFLMGLCRHLLFQGYLSDDVTIITPYLGQYRCLKKLQKQRDFYACKEVRISVLDNYQGEESNIILLSLVRSNEEEKVGFLKIDNRVCVALSRAKHGMYVIGNMSQMAKANELWKKINKKLVDGGNIGPELELVCEIHPEQVMKVASLSEILFKSPEGGCKQPCSAYLPTCGHKCPRLCHVADQDHTNVNCTRPCPKVICNLGHMCPKLCFQDCEECAVLIKKLLPCGHEHQVKCSVKPEDFKCPTIMTKELPHCKHKQDLECWVDVNTCKCKENCVVRLDCGHQCKNKCHPLRDPNHEEYDCHVPCDKKPENCEFNHSCRKKCYENCGPCGTIITRNMKCGHTLNNIKCGILEKDIKCPQKCKLTLSCGHRCTKTCGEDCGGCKEPVEKIVADCGHKVKIPCSSPPSLKYCSGKCTKFLPCQHRCTKKCNESCSSQCNQLVESTFKCPKGHKVKLPCYLAQTSGSTLSKSSTALEGKTVGEYCTETCGMSLDCEHACESKCGECLNGRLHATCKNKCNKTLVCGHVCKEPCSMDCPPCQSNCLWQCSHSRCKKHCGVPCINCKENCTRQCPHSACTSKCGNQCNTEPCPLPCPKKIKKCGHDCIGYCGEPCPAQCRICDKDEVTEIFFGTEEDEDVRFVLLEDCGHIFEGESLDGWMKNEPTEDGKVEISMKLCPRCKTPIYCTQRYQNIILSTYSNVMKVKRKHFTNKRTVNRTHLKEIMKELQHVWRSEISSLREYLGFDVNFLPKKKQKTLSDQQHLLYEFQLNFLKSAKATNDKLEGKNSKLLKLTEKLMKYNISISQQAMTEFSCELRRIEICSLVEKVRTRVSTSTNSISFSFTSSPLNSLVAKIDTIMDPTIRFDLESEKKVMDCLKESERYIGSLGITNEERLQILNAMGLSQGHWYACPNGHVYCITECGGAMVESVCPDCKAPIGGGSHRLRSDNRIATEMDGATRSVYPYGA